MNNSDPVGTGIMIIAYQCCFQEEQGEFEAAKQSYLEAIAAFDAGLLINPDDTRALSNKASALSSLGRLQEKLSERQEALKSWREALKTYNEFLWREPYKERARYMRDMLQEDLDKLERDTVN